MNVAKKYYWTREEEAKLLELWKKGIRDPHVLAKELDRKPIAVEMKLRRLGVVVMKQKIPRTTTTAIESRDLFTHEETLKILAGALETLREPGQDKLELQRLMLQTCPTSQNQRTRPALNQCPCIQTSTNYLPHALSLSPY